METETLVLTAATAEDQLLLDPALRRRLPEAAAAAAREWALARAVGSGQGAAKAVRDVLRALAGLPPGELEAALGRPAEVRAADPWVARNFEVGLDDLPALLAGSVPAGGRFAVSRVGGRAYVTVWR